MSFIERIKGIFNKPDRLHSVKREEIVDLNELLKKINIYKRTTWMPLVDDERETALASKIGGTAYVPAGSEHPTCPNCGKTMTLFLQLNPHDLPAKCDLDLAQDQLIQLFYCVSESPHCESECEAYFPFSKSVVAQTVPLPEENLESLTIKYKNQFPAKTIVDWIVYEDLPDWHEMQVGKAGLTDKEVNYIEENNLSVPKAADKLGGWPYWIQSVEYPTCPKCSIQMQMIFQLDSNHHLPYMFGDAGIAHLHQCRIHKEILAFGWSSY